MGKDLNEISVNALLKNALIWKQWIVDDFRLLIELKEQGEVSSESLHSLVIHHLKVYQMMNDMFGLYMNDDEGNVLFEFPSLKSLQEIVPTLDVSSNEDLNKLIEPMLELELDELSEELHECMSKEKVEELIVESLDTEIDVFISDEGFEEFLDEDDIVSIVELDDEEIEIDEIAIEDLDEPEEPEEIEEIEDKVTKKPETIEMIDEIWTSLSDDLVGVRTGNDEVSIDG